MQVRHILAAAVFSLSALGGASALAGDDSRTNAVGTTSYSAQGVRTREEVVAETRAPVAASVGGGVNNAVGTTSYPFHEERSRASVVADLRAVQSAGTWRPTGEVGDAPVVQQILQDTAIAHGQARTNVAQARVHRGRTATN